MTTKDKVQAIAAIIEQFYEQDGGGQAALGTISAISAIVDMPEEDDREAAITALDKAFGITDNQRVKYGDAYISLLQAGPMEDCVQQSRSAASAAFDKMMFGDNADV